MSYVPQSPFAVGLQREKSSRALVPDRVTFPIFAKTSVSRTRFGMLWNIIVKIGLVGSGDERHRTFSFQGLGGPASSEKFMKQIRF